MAPDCNLKHKRFRNMGLDSAILVLYVGVSRIFKKNPINKKQPHPKFSFVVCAVSTRGDLR